MAVILFWVFSIIAIIFSLLVIVQRKAIYSALSLIVVLCSFSGLYALMGASFLAAIQVVVYAGAIMVLFVFIIWLLGLRTGQEASLPRGRWLYLSLILALGIGAHIVYIFAKYLRGLEFSRAADIKEIAKMMLGRYVLPFELTSILFLVALVGAFYIARNKVKEFEIESKEKEEKRREVKKKEIKS